MAFRTNKTPVLQTKSASGAVATFNTALAMPLASCKIAVTAWQEGSGDPSPSNVRPIHGFSEVNVMANNVVTTIQLGQEVYGAEVDVVNGVAHVTHKYKNVGECIFGYYDAQYGAFRSFSITDSKRREASEKNAICTNYKEVGRMSASEENNAFCLNSSKHTVNSFYIKDNRFTSEQITQFNEAMNGVYICYELAEPFDIQLTTTQIKTLIGNNTIIADTGNVDLTYKDLDIAKRGNFREVFRLPLKKEARND